MTVQFIRNNKRSLYLILFYLVLILLVSYFWPKQIDWSPSYSEMHTKPYGGQVLSQELSDLFPSSKVRFTDKPIYNVVNDSIPDIGNGVYIFFNAMFFPDSLELSRLYSFVENGNTAFVSAMNIGNDLLDTLQLVYKEVYKTNLNTKNDSIVYTFYAEPINGESYLFPSNNFVRYFQADTLAEGTAIAGLLDSNRYNQISIPFGKGNFILNSNPLAFTNYYVLDDNTRKYASNCLSYLGNPSYILWDEYYKVGNTGGSKTPLSEILKIPAFKWAYWITLSAILLFIGFHAKRRQRIIPIQKAYTNSSVEYTKTIGSLYFESSNYKEMALKKIEYFKEHLHRKYRLKNIQFNAEDVQTLSEKTAIPKEDLTRLFNTIHKIEDSGALEVSRLKELIKEINNFYKNS